MDKSGYNLTFNGDVTINVNTPKMESNKTSNRESDVENRKNEERRYKIETQTREQVKHLLRLDGGNLLLSTECYTSSIQTTIRFILQFLMERKEEDAYSVNFYGCYIGIIDPLSEIGWKIGAGKSLQFRNGSSFNMEREWDECSDISIFDNFFEDRENIKHHSKYNIFITRL